MVKRVFSVQQLEQRSFRCCCKFRVSFPSSFSSCAGKPPGYKDIMDADPPIKRVKRTGRILGALSDSNCSSAISKARNKDFGHLGLEALGINEQLGKRTKVRNHSNPLSAQHSVAVTPAKPWNELYLNPKNDLFIDIGCGAGRFVISAAQSNVEQLKSMNYLGLEIRAPLVTRANAWVKELNLKNVSFLACNANVSLEKIVEGYPGKIMVTAVQFPDPHFKKKHQKRRVVTQEFLNIVAKIMPKNEGLLWLQSDVESAVAQMRDRTHLNKYYERVGEYTPRDPLLDLGKCAEGGDSDVVLFNNRPMNVWTTEGKRNLPGNKDYGDWLKPGQQGLVLGFKETDVMTERESQNRAMNMPVYKALFRRNNLQYQLDRDEILRPLISGLEKSTYLLHAVIGRLNNFQTRVHSLLLLLEQGSLEFNKNDISTENLKTKLEIAFKSFDEPKQCSFDMLSSIKLLVADFSPNGNSVDKPVPKSDSILLDDDFQRFENIIKADTEKLHSSIHSLKESLLNSDLLQNLTRQNEGIKQNSKIFEFLNNDIGYIGNLETDFMKSMEIAKNHLAEIHSSNK